MSEAIRRTPYRVAAVEALPSPEAFQFRVFSLGLLATVIVTLMAGSLLAGFCFVTLGALTGLLWRRDGVQVLPFVFGYQWLQIVAGYFFYLAYGYFPVNPAVGNVEQAVWLSLLGLLVLALGIRLGDSLVRHLLSGFKQRGERQQG